MHQPGLENLQAEISSTRAAQPVGRVSAISQGLLEVRGLSEHASVGDLVRVAAQSGKGALGEIVAVKDDRLSVLTERQLDGLARNSPVVLSGRSQLAPDASWVGRIIDPMGRPLDNRPLLRGLESRPLQGPPPAPIERRGFGVRVDTGLRAFDTLLPIVRGQRIGLFAGSGVGKSSLLARLAQGLEADVIVIALVGERGREVRDFVQNVLGKDGMARSVVVAATSDRSPWVRRRCGWTAMTIAEHFRDQGQHVLLLVDSLTRFAEAHREIALSTGETAALRGHPSSTSHLIPGLCERAGPGTAGTGDITAVFSVLVAGSDMDEPIADMARGVLDGHVVLDREIAERGRFPAIDILRSVSRSLPEAASNEENMMLQEVRRLLGAYARAELMIRSGLYERGSDPIVDRAIAVWPKLDAFIGKLSFDGVAGSFADLEACLATEPEQEGEPAV